MIALLVHGWGFDPAIWRRLRPMLPIGSVCWDLGCFGPPALDPPPDGPILAIGHSYGAFWLLRRRPWAARWCGFVGLNAFLRFPVADRILQRMQSRLDVRSDGRAEAWSDGAARGVIAAFHDQCGLARSGLADCAPAPERVPCIDQLRAALRELRTETAMPPSCPSLFLAGGRDAVVPVPIPAATILPEGDHLLPASAPAWCADAIGRFVTGLA